MRMFVADQRRHCCLVVFMQIRSRVRWVDGYPAQERLMFTKYKEEARNSKKETTNEFEIEETPSCHSIPGSSVG